MRQATGLRPPWGLLTGVRPLNLLRKQRRLHGAAAAEAHFLKSCDVSEEKYRLAAQIAELQQPILSQNAPPGYSLYLSIPFCPSRCAYCSFVSQSIEKQAHLIDPYLDKLVLELAETARVAKACGLRLQTVYIGGGTPTALDEKQLERLLRAVEQHFAPAQSAEYTVEAGRPDCTTPAKLRLLKDFGVHRVSINPQSMRDEVLRRIGRSHTAQDIRRCYADAAALGFESINMDLIAGLPGDDEAGFAATLEELIAMAPGNITLHSLTMKRASHLAQQGARPQKASPGAMLAAAYPRMAAAGYAPYYLYRQKSSIENLENTGWCKPGLAGIYNICIMEEAHTILAVGAGAVTKLVLNGGATIKRLYNFKFPKEYIEQFSDVLQRKRGVEPFYAGNMDSQTTG